MLLKILGNLIKTQDNRFTDKPIFVVEKSVMVITDSDYGYDKKEWVNTESGDYEVASETKARRLDALLENYLETGDWKKFYYKETWEFVTSCFTEQGCKDYLELNGHNLGKRRICAYGSYRNEEFRTLRDMFIAAA